MNIFTVTSTDDPSRDTIDRCVAGSYTSLDRAVDECVKYVRERLELRDDIVWAMAHDENHKEAAGFFSVRKDGSGAYVKRGCVRRLEKFLRGELYGQRCYYIYDGDNSFHFDIDENDLVGEVWNTVTWGSSDCEDPNFTTPWPETFTSREAAIKTFVDYVDDLVRSRSGGDFSLAKAVKQRIRNELERDGKCQYDLADGCCVSCVLYHDDAKNVKG